MLDKGNLQSVKILELHPNNWFINQVKLAMVRNAWRLGEQDLLPPILVAEIEGTLSLIDGHSRAYAAFEMGKTYIKASISRLDDIEGSSALYMHLHREGLKLGIKTIADLRYRIVEPEEHRRLWVDYCKNWIEENDPSDNVNTPK